MKDELKLINYGFTKDNNIYKLKKELDNNFYVIIEIDKDIKCRVYDRFTNEEYLPFNVINSSSGYILEIRNKVKNIEKDIINKCYINNNIKDKVIEYIKDKYKINPEYPWEQYSNYCTFKVNNKWFGIIMNISLKSLGMNSNEEVDIINVKVNNIDNLIDNKNIFKAYHMNKKYWITIILNNNINFDKIVELIDESYNNILN